MTADGIMTILTLLGAFPRGKRRGANYKYSVLKFLLENREPLKASEIADGCEVPRTNVYGILDFFKYLKVLKICTPIRLPEKYNDWGQGARASKRRELGIAKNPGQGFQLDMDALIGAIDEIISKLGEEEADRHSLRVIELERLREKAVDVIPLEMI